MRCAKTDPDTTIIKKKFLELLVLLGSEVQLYMMKAWSIWCYMVEAWRCFLLNCTPIWLMAYFITNRECHFFFDDREIHCFWLGTSRLILTLNPYPLKYGLRATTRLQTHDVDIRHIPCYTTFSIEPRCIDISILVSLNVVDSCINVIVFIISSDRIYSFRTLWILNKKLKVSFAWHLFSFISLT